MDLSIVVPTYNEQENVEKLVRQLRRVMLANGLTYEIIFIDDSNDETPKVLQHLSNYYSEVNFFHREGRRGLASAVVDGFLKSQGECIIVMDADLQHPPEMLSLIMQRLNMADIVIPSRFVEGGSDGGLHGYRKLISWAARLIGRFSIRRLREISDCTGGYFGIRCKVIEGVQLDPIGWKILIEVLVKGNYETVHEIPYTFLARNDGKSKMDLKEQWNYLVHITRLVKSSPEDLRFYSFCLVGLLGVFVNLFTLTALVKVFGFETVRSSLGASIIALLHNYVLNERITWRDCKKPIIVRRAWQLPQFMIVCGFGIAITSLFMQLFISMGWNIYVGQLMGIIAATAWNYSANNRWTWARSNQSTATRNKMRVTQELPHEIS